MKKFIISAIALIATTLIGTADVPRPEYPRPQFERQQWENLNGQWTYEFDLVKTGMERKLYESKGFSDEITVPFCPESKLSGVEHTDFIPAMWYHRKISMPAEWQGQDVLLHFGGVDFFSAVYIDGKLVGRHFGGSSPFVYDITEYINDGKEHDMVVRVEDDVRAMTQGNGKQCHKYDRFGCHYTRTTGIWQTVWMEPVCRYALDDVYIVPDFDNSTFVVYPKMRNLAKGLTVTAEVKANGKTVSKASRKAAPGVALNLPIKKARQWNPADPFLYDIEFTVTDGDGSVVDKVQSYAGMRKVHIEGDKFYLNNEPIFQRLVLDQGFYPDGVWTAPSDEALKQDIQLSMDAGFNGARLHQKMFDPRFFYWADKLGYLTWAEFPSWGANTLFIESARNFMPEWETLVVRDRNHPSIVAWTPFNETWERPEDSEEAMQHDRFVADVYRLTHDLDYRPVNDCSGNYHVVTDLWTVHRYDQEPAKLAEFLDIKDGKYPQQDPKREISYGGQPIIIDEYGGIKWVGEDFGIQGWGYGNGPQDIEEFYQRLSDLTDVIVERPYMSGYCYTQITDVMQEQNGVYNFDRTKKFDMDRIREIFSRKPAWSKW